MPSHPTSFVRVFGPSMQEEPGHGSAEVPLKAEEVVVFISIKLNNPKKIKNPRHSQYVFMKFREDFLKL